MNIKKIKDNIKQREFNLYNTFVGTAIVCVGMLTDKTEEEMMNLFDTLSHHKNLLKELTALGVVNYIWTVFGDDSKKELRSRLVLITDTNNILSPRIALIDNEDHILPFPKGFPVGIIADAMNGKDNANVEYLYDENGDDYEEEGDEE